MRVRHKGRSKEFVRGGFLGDSVVGQRGAVLGRSAPSCPRM